MFKLVNMSDEALSKDTDDVDIVNTDNVHDIYNITLNFGLAQDDARHFQEIAEHMKWNDMFWANQIMMYCMKGD